VSVDRSGAWALVANYGDGEVAVLPIAADGALSPAIAATNAGANAHQIVTDGANAVAYVPCKGDDLVAIFGLDAATGALDPRTPTPGAAGAGPRHLALHPDGAHAYVINELDSTVTSYAVGAAGALTPIGTISSLPDGFLGPNTGAEIEVHPNGDWVYASNRGDDSIAIFAVQPNGALSLVDHVSTGGAVPRHFSLLPGGRALLVANQGSDTIHGFHLDPATGLLTPAGELASVPSPAFVAAIGLP
jgi:6-phosphogluconolactonase